MIDSSPEQGRSAAAFLNNQAGGDNDVTNLLPILRHPRGYGNCLGSEESRVQLGCDPVLLRRQSIVTPQCGLATHSVAVAQRIARLTADVGKRVQDQSSATRFALGA